jgi:PAS domain S-box-containing protein
MLGPSNTATNDLPDLTILQTLPLPLLVLSFGKTILVATEAVKRLLAWSQWHSNPLVGCSLAELGVSLAVEEACEEQDLDATLDQMARKHMNAACKSSHPSELTGKDNPRKSGREDSESSSTAGDTEFGAWQEDWCLELLVDVQRAPQNRSVVRAKLSVRIWSTDESPLYVLTFAKPITPPSSPNPSIHSQSAGEDARKAKKLATLAQILDYMPNLPWTARPDGEPDYFSERWYDYTHASRTETFKELWARTVHPEDKDATWDSWIECTRQGQEFEIEARYKRFDGMYRYHLIHGVPQRNDDGEIVKWHGACTDIHELVTQRIEASRLKQQILTMLAHGEINLFVLNKNMEVMMLEGSIKWGTQASAAEKAALVGNELVDIVEKMSEDGAKGAADFIEAVQKILRGDSTMEVLEYSLDKRWYRSRFIADIEPNNENGQDTIRGVLGFSIDITDMKARMALELEKTQLVADETAAKEANMLKSQFLANVSHELRTPISGVLGMADLLADTPLADEQREYARGISQSADSLLGIVNDILDASKIEAGRFDIESVEFNLSGVVEDLYKMMAYAAQRKQLLLHYKTALKPFERVIGDPGRTRQILVNL